MGRVSSAVVALEGAETATDSEAEIVGKMQPKGKVHNDFSAILFLYLFFFFLYFHFLLRRCTNISQAKERGVAVHSVHLFIPLLPSRELLPSLSNRGPGTGTMLSRSLASFLCVTCALSLFLSF